MMQSRVQYCTISHLSPASYWLPPFKQDLFPVDFKFNAKKKKVEDNKGWPLELLQSFTQARHISQLL